MLSRELVLFCVLINLLVSHTAKADLLTQAFADSLLGPEAQHGREFQFSNPFDYIGERRKVAKAFRSSNLVPDILDEVPRQLLRVSYGENKVFLGSNLTVPIATPLPEVKWSYGRIRTFFSWFFPVSKNLFTLIMLDPDALCRGNPYYRSVLHWLIANIERDDLSTGDEVAPYLPPGPLPGTGPHRYVLLVFKQPDNEQIVYPEYPDLSSRLHFNLTDFIAEYGLSSNPEAGNYFLVENPDAATVPDPCDPSALSN